MTLETCRGVSFYIIYVRIVYQVGTNKGIIINYVKAQRLSWYGHIYRKPETSIVKKIHKWQPYSGCPRRKGQTFGRVFLMLKYIDITQNTYIQS